MSGISVVASPSASSSLLEDQGAVSLVPERSRENPKRLGRVRRLGIEALAQPLPPHPFDGGGSGAHVWSVDGIVALLG